jgi:hypothetical protein
MRFVYALRVAADPTSHRLLGLSCASSDNIRHGQIRLYGYCTATGAANRTTFLETFSAVS